MKFAKPPLPPFRKGGVGGFEKYFLVLFLELRNLMSYKTMKPWK
jgi:hypothetical protein